MVKVASVTVDGRKIDLAFDTRALIDVEERYGSMQAVADAVNGGKTMEQLELILILARGGDRRKPEDCCGDLTAEWLIDNAAPHEIKALYAAAISNITDNLTGRESAPEAGPVDVTLVELEGKNVQS